MSTVLTATRLQLVAWPVGLGWPWAILACSFVVNYGIFSVVELDGVEQPSTGGLLSIYICILIASVAAVTQIFPFALGMGLTRWAFSAGTALFTTVQALCAGLVIYLLSLVEGATGGWGLRLSFFRIGFAAEGSPMGQVLVYAGPFVLASGLGLLLGVIQTRWGQNGAFALLAATTLIVGGAAAILTWRELWGPLGSWLDDTAALVTVGAGPAAIGLVMTGLGWLALRRATP